ncbi:MAG: hypothetical protein H8E37_09335 [Planctomycetes bacterium]|nr:hypothetical protein [Planctomycetota bacterium]
MRNLDHECESVAGDILRNTTSENQQTGLLLSAPSFSGNISDNISNDNEIGLFVRTEVFTGDVSGNTATDNTSEGLVVSIFTPLLAAETEPNNSRATAQNIDTAGFTLDDSFNVTDPTTIPHVSISGTGDDTFDYFSFTADAASRGIFDIDNSSFDTELFLYDPSGTLLAATTTVSSATLETACLITSPSSISSSARQAAL